MLNFDFKMIRFVSFLLLIILPEIVISQVDKSNDSLGLEQLEQVIVTGQLRLESVEKSVVEVKVITRNTIDRQAGNTLADVLNNTLNLNITPNTTTGKSGISLFGLDGQYFKILIDNIPIINEEGLGNNTDLTLINLDDVERIEIVEGAMGVQYGSNAVSGIINIITKKSSKNKFDVSVYLQEETVGSEYEFFNKGRHIQSVRLGHNFSERIYASATFTRNDFAGFLNDRLGENYDKNDGLRGHEWLPKTQQNVKALLSYKEEKASIFYKFDYLNETIEKYNNIVNLNENPATDTQDPLSLDEQYANNRFYHHLNASGKLFDQLNYNISVSYQEQTKSLKQYTYRIRPQLEENITEGEYQGRSAFFSRGTLSNLINSERISIQAGYEIINEKGSGSSLAVTIDPNEDEIFQSLNSYDGFMSSEIKVSSKFSLRPGARISFSNLFHTQFISSLSVRQDLGKNWVLRAIIGSANRTPSYDELYTFFVDVNHNLQGNPELNPEKGISTFLHLKKRSTLFDGKLRLKNKVSLNYLGLTDRIEFIVVEQTPLAFQYNNIDSYRAVGIFSENEAYFQNFKGQLGVSAQGVSKILDSREDSDENFLFNFQLNATLGYTVKKWQTTFSMLFKYIGKHQQFVEKTNADGEQEFQRGTTNPYSWMDVTINTSFLKKSVMLTVGSRNLFNVTSVNTTAFEGGAHDGTPAQVPLGYGRSYFLKLAYNLNI